MRELKFDFYGVGVAVRCGDASLRDELRRDFEYFSGDSAKLEISLELRRGPIPRGAIPEGRPTFRTREYAAFDRSGRRIVDYQGRALAVLDFRSETVEVVSEDRDLLRELGYLLVSSRVGYLLDLRGLHRVHALGMAYRGRGVLLLLPSGGGKTTLFLELLRVARARLLSEDTPLVDRRGVLYPFPLRLGLTPQHDLTNIPPEVRREFHRRRHGRKILVDLPYFRDSLGAAVPCGLVVVGRRTSGGKLSARRVSGVSALGALLSSLLVGRGVPQLTEFMLRTDVSGLAGLARIAASRARAIGALLRRSQTQRLTLGPDPAANADELLRLAETTFL